MWIKKTYIVVRALLEINYQHWFLSNKEDRKRNRSSCFLPRILFPPLPSAWIGKFLPASKGKKGCELRVWLYQLTEGGGGGCSQYWRAPTFYGSYFLLKTVTLMGLKYLNKSCDSRPLTAKVKYGVRCPKFIRAPCHVMWTAVLIGWDPTTHPVPLHLDSFTRALLVRQDRRHLLVTPCLIAWMETYQ